MDQFVLQNQFMPSLRKIHRCLRSRDMGGIHHSEMILLSMYHRSTDPGETSMRVKELGRCSNISPTALSRCLRQLEKEGLIRRTIDPSDRRSLRVQLTNAGTDRAARLDSDSNYCFDRIFQAMGEKDARELVRLTGIFSELLEEEDRTEQNNERRTLIH